MLCQQDLACMTNNQNIHQIKIMFVAKSCLHDEQQSIGQDKHQCVTVGKNSAGRKCSKGKWVQNQDEKWRTEAQGFWIQ